MYKFFLLCLWLVLASTLTACGGSQTSTAPESKIASATFNGVSKIDPVAGTAQLSISALDKDKNVLETGTISEVTATINNFLGGSFTASQVSASVCGNIASKSATNSALHAALTLDSTGSMTDSDPNQLRDDAAKSFLTRLGSDDQVAVNSFDTSTDATVPYTAVKVWQDFTSDKALLETAITSATFENGGTNVWDAGVDSIQLLKTASGDNKMVVLFTDGEDNASTKEPIDVISEANLAGVAVYTIGLGTTLSFADLVTLSSSTGGTFNQVAEAKDLQGLFDNVFNASQAAGCVALSFTPAPPSGTTISGTVSFKVDGTQVVTLYNIRFP